jgi:hypothetical protein
MALKYSLILKLIAQKPVPNIHHIAHRNIIHNSIHIQFVIQRERELTGVNFEFGRRARPWHNMFVLLKGVEEILK